MANPLAQISQTFDLIEQPAPISGKEWLGVAAFSVLFGLAGASLAAQVPGGPRVPDFKSPHFWGMAGAAGLTYAAGIAIANRRPNKGWV